MFCFLLHIKKQVNWDLLTDVRILYTGTMLPVGDEYKLALQDGTWVASHNRSEGFKDNISEAEVDETFVNDLKEVLTTNKTHRWDGFKKSNKHVDDGDRFEFDMYFSDGTTIHASGYMSYPKNFHTVLSAFKERYDSLFKK